MKNIGGKSRFVAFFGECGDHSLVKIDQDFPLFLLATVVIERSAYVDKYGKNATNPYELALEFAMDEIFSPEMKIGTSVSRSTYRPSIPSPQISLHKRRDLRNPKIAPTRWRMMNAE